jgi:serine/threonine-protein kinase
MQRVGRYLIFDELASGGMGAVHMGRLVGPVGFSRTVAIKRMHPLMAKNPEMVRMFVDEARIAARIEHPNVVGTLDVVAENGELFLAMEYVEGESLATLAALAAGNGERAPLRVVISIICDALGGLHAAHETRQGGESMHLVHRDVSPQNILVGTDGVARVVDFGVAKARGRLHTTKDGAVRGKMAYMPVEQICGAPVDRRADIYAIGVVLWEVLAGQSLFRGETDAATIQRVLQMSVKPPSAYSPEVGGELDAIVLRALSRDAEQRFESATAMAEALDRALRRAPSSEVGAWVRRLARESLAAKAARLMVIERESSQPDADPVLELKRREKDDVATRPSLQEPRGEMAASLAALADVTTERAVTHEGAQRSKRSGRARRVVPVVAFLFAAGGLGALFVRSRHHAPASAQPPPGATQFETAVAAAVATSPVPTAHESANATSSAGPAPSGGRVTLAPSASLQPTSRAGASARPVQTSPKRAREPSCDPPYVVDSAGIVRYRKECLR